MIVQYLLLLFFKSHTVQFLIFDAAWTNGAAAPDGLNGVPVPGCTPFRCVVLLYDTNFVIEIARFEPNL